MYTAVRGERQSQKHLSVGRQMANEAGGGENIKKGNNAFYIGPV